MEPRGRRRKQQGAAEEKENTASAAPPAPKRPRCTERRALAELPAASTANNASAAPTGAPSKPMTRAAAREAAAAAVEEEARRREGSAIAARPAASRQTDAGAAQASVGPYVADIDGYLRSLEVEQLRRPRDDYMVAMQKDISATMRVTRDKLQLLGVASLFVAAKYEEIHVPKLDKFSDITDGTYTNQQVVKMEADILKYLNFQMGSPTVRTFLLRFLISCCGGNCASAKRLELMCCYLAELSLLDYDCIRFLPSVIAAACLFLARFTISPKICPWNFTLQEKTGYKVSDLRSCILRIHDLQLGRQYSNLKAIKSKYSERKFGCVSMMASSEEIPASLLKDLDK
ncbi:hypothetical protein CFC21_051295 [Triticum aestivum]|uniref:Cyclin N-terminal domain-containing protein n=2 Tax=Triticum aestivum TaxID=4565 RepID=A0A3B6HSK9_WHEAT|nr:cyclin-A3-2-like isoform X2 [Triticum dicoccoides]KAF7041508.1 hypothetical protein CFC21_051295 [Triticum aestivum]